MKVYLHLFVLTMLYTVSFKLNGQANMESNGTFKYQVEVYAGGNFSISPSESPALNFFAFYNYRDAKYSSFSGYYPLLDKLENTDAVWKLEPAYEFGTRLLLFSGAACIGLNLNVTQNASKATVTQQQDTATAQLIFEGKEWRVLLKPSIGYKKEKLHLYGNLIVGLGLGKQYNSYLIVTEGEQKQTRLPYDNDYFKSADFTYGLGFGADYYLSKKINIGLAYNLYRVKTSPYKTTQTFDFKRFVNGYWSNTFSLTLGYQLFVSKNYTL